MPDDKDRASRLHSALVVEELVAANNQSNNTMINLVETVRQETAARDRKVEALERSSHQMRLLMLIGIIALVGLLVLAGFNAINITQTRDAAHQQAAIALSVQHTNDLLLDCLNSTGTCGQVNQQNQAKILDEVKKYELTGFYCIRNNPADSDPKGTEFLACMNKLYPGGPQLNGR
jgi:hypothetical protein